MLLTLKQLAAESGYSVSTLYRLCAPSGDLPCVRSSLGTAKRRTSGAIRVARSDWDAWLAKRRSAPIETPAAPIREHARRAALRALPGASRYVS